MAGKSYIKVGSNDWDRIKKMYIKAAGQTWIAVRKSYIKTSSGWQKVFDTASNRPFISGNDFPKIRLNTFRTNSSVAGTVNPVVEAPPVQQMGPPTTVPTVGWPSGTIGSHLYGYDGTWVSGNGSAMTFAYRWFYNLTGNANDDTEELNATSSTGRADMITNSSTHLGQSDGDYFDKNFLTFKVTATNSAGNATAPSTPVYIVRQKPTGTITMPVGDVIVGQTLAASFSYSNFWYNKTDLSDSKIEWFAIDNPGDPLTTNNRVAIEPLGPVVVTGTNTKSGTVYHVPQIANKIYAAQITLNNSNTQNAVIAINGFIPNLPFTTPAYSTPGSPLEVTTLDILDYYNNEGTDNRLYIPNGGLFKIRSNVTGVDGNTTYRIRYRMYNWQNGSYYGMDGTNYGASANSAWTTRTGTNSSFGFGGSLINVISVAGTTATLTHNEMISSAHFGSTTFDGSQDRWQIEIEVSTLKTGGTTRKYYLDIVEGISYYVSRPATLLLTASPGTAPINTNITLNGTISALGGGLSYPRQYKVNFGDGSDSGWLPVGGYAYGTSNPSFSITKQYSTTGDYYPSFTTIPDYSSANTNVIIASVPTITMGANTGVTSTQGTINWTSTNQASFSSSGTISGSGSTGTSVTNNALSAGTTYNGTVTVTSSTGHTASANYSLTTSAATFTMPNIIGMTKTTGGNAIVAAGFYWEGDYPYTTNDINLDQIIFAQTPAAGFVGVPQNAYFDYYNYVAPAATPLATPAPSASSNRTDGILVSWSAIPNASYYGVWYRGGAPVYDTNPDFGGPNNPIYGTSYLDTSAPVGSRQYDVQAYPAVGSTTFLKSQYGGPATGTRQAVVVTQYTISWNGNGGSVSPGSNTVNSGTTVSAPTPTRSGYTFLYWRDSPSAFSYIYQINPGGSWTVTSNITFYAYWQIVAVAAPSTPTGLSLTGSGAVSWNAASGADYYEVLNYTDQTGSPSNTNNRLGPYNTTVYGTSLQLGSSQGYSSPNNWARVQVRAWNNSGQVSTYSAWVPSNSTYT